MADDPRDAEELRAELNRCRKRLETAARGEAAAVRDCDHVKRDLQEAQKLLKDQEEEIRDQVLLLQLKHNRILELEDALARRGDVTAAAKPAEVEQLKREVESLRARLARGKSPVDADPQELRDLMVQVEVMKIEHDQEIRKKKEEIDFLHEKLDIAEDELAHTKRELAKTKVPASPAVNIAEYEGLQNRLLRANEQIDSLKKENKRLTRDAADYAGTKEAAQKEIEQREVQLTKKQAELEATKRKLLQLVEANEALQLRTKKLDELVVFKDQEIERHRDMLTEMERAADLAASTSKRRSDELSDLQSSAATAHAKLKEREEELDQMVTSLTRTRAELRETQRTAKALEEENAELRSRDLDMRRLQKEHNETLDALEAELQMQRSRAKDAHKELQSVATSWRSGESPAEVADALRGILEEQLQQAGRGGQQSIPDLVEQIREKIDIRLQLFTATRRFVNATEELTCEFCEPNADERRLLAEPFPLSVANRNQVVPVTRVLDVMEKLLHAALRRKDVAPRQEWAQRVPTGRRSDSSDDLPARQASTTRDLDLRAGSDLSDSVSRPRRDSPYALDDEARRSIPRSDTSVHRDFDSRVPARSRSATPVELTRLRDKPYDSDYGRSANARGSDSSVTRTVRGGIAEASRSRQDSPFKETEWSAGRPERSRVPTPVEALDDRVASDASRSRRESLYATDRHADDQTRRASLRSADARTRGSSHTLGDKVAGVGDSLRGATYDLDSRSRAYVNGSDSDRHPRRSESRAGSLGSSVERRTPQPRSFEQDRRASLRSESSRRPRREDPESSDYSAPVPRHRSRSPKEQGNPANESPSATPTSQAGDRRVGPIRKIVSSHRSSRQDSDQESVTQRPPSRPRPSQPTRRVIP